MLKKAETGSERDKALIFDMDGVLIDSQPIHFEVDMRVLNGRGADAGLADVAPFAGVSNADRWSGYKRIYSLRETVPELIGIHTGIMMEIFRNAALKPIGGVAELLSAARGLGFRTAVASSSSMELIRLVVDRLGFSEYFDALVTGEDVERGKPAPDVFLKAAGVLGAPPGRCVVVEDSANGVLAARRAGMKCIGFRNPNSGGQDLGMAGWVVESFGEVTGERLVEFLERV